jgi:hypothetical protein
VVGLITGQPSPLQRRTHFIYADSSHVITTESDQTTFQDGGLKGELVYDGLGRAIEIRQYAPEGIIRKATTYDGLGRVQRAYNPYRTTSEDTYGYTDTSYDILGRVSAVTTYDKNGASTGTVTTTYDRNATTVTDQAGKARRSIFDGLGRMIRVDEPNSSGSLGTVTSPTQPTSYT